MKTTVKLSFLLLLIGLALPMHNAAADEQTDHLNDLAKQAKAKGDLDQEANYLCQAADTDPSHYEKKCKRARADAEKAMNQFEGYFKTAKFELQQKDYPGAIRDLGKITFGPHREEAQLLIQQTKAALAEGSAELADQVPLREAQAAYERGDFETAATQANLVRSAVLQPAARQLLTNIKVYQDTMAQADLLVHNGDYKEAQEKYSFALRIKDNGPGSPAEKLQAVEVELERQAAAAAAKAQPASDTTAQVPVPGKSDTAKLIKSDLAEALRQESKHDFKGALHAFDRALALDPHQAEALAGKQRVMSELKGDQKALATSLEDGIRSYYSSDFDQATESISLYLNGGGLRNKGAAHFYLAASLYSQAIFTDPHDQAHMHTLQQNADEEFKLARQENYKPVEKLVSPRILAEWTHVENQP